MSSSTDATRMWRKKVRAIFEKAHALDEIKPGSMLGRMNILESSGTCGEEGHGLLRDVRGMVVENHANNGLGRIVSINLPEQIDELDATVPILGMSKDMARVKVDTGQNGDRAVTNVLGGLRRNPRICGALHIRRFRLTTPC
mgnify:CR=1 FL=1